MELLLRFIPKEPRVPVKAIETIVLIVVEFGVVSLASVAIPTIFDNGSPALLLLGIGITIISWVSAIIISWKFYEH